MLYELFNWLSTYSHGIEQKQKADPHPWVVGSRRKSRCSLAENNLSVIRPNPARLDVGLHRQP
jgi:hypothetical protein